MKPIYELVFTFIERPPGTQASERSIRAHFTLPDGSPLNAATAALAWVRNRQAAVPEWFGPLAVLEVCAWTPPEARDDGYLEMASRRMVFHLKESDVRVGRELVNVAAFDGIELVRDPITGRNLVEKTL